MPSFTDDCAATISSAWSRMCAVRAAAGPHVRRAPRLDAGARSKGFVPVTGEMLARPPPEDWPSFRRTHDAVGIQSARPDHAATTSGGCSSSGRGPWNRAASTARRSSIAARCILAHPGDVIEALDATTGDSDLAVPLGAAAGGEDRSTIVAPDGENAAPRRERLRSVVNIAMFGDKTLSLHARSAPHRRQRAQRQPRVVGRRGRPRHRAHGRADHRRRQGRQRAVVRRHRRTGGRATSPRTTSTTAMRCGACARSHARANPVTRRGGGLPYEKRVHVGAWGVGSYDPALNLIFWGTSVPAPSLERLRGTVGGDVLFSNSTLAIDAATGASCGTTSICRATTGISTTSSSGSSWTSRRRRIRRACAGSIRSSRPASVRAGGHRHPRQDRHRLHPRPQDRRVPLGARDDPRRTSSETSTPRRVA